MKCYLRLPVRLGDRTTEAISPMHLTDHDLRQLDRDALSRLREDAARGLLERVVDDLKEARDRLRQDSRNSSRPPSSDSVYGTSRDGSTEDDTLPDDPAPAEATASGQADETTTAGGGIATPADHARKDPADSDRDEPARRHRGHQPGAPGFGRTQKLAVDVTCAHRPEQCAACSLAFPSDAVGQAYGGYDEIDLLPADPNLPGLRLFVTRHLLLEDMCACGHCTRYVPLRAVVLPEWEGVGVAAQQMVGPRLAGLIVMLCLRYRLSRGKVQELLLELVGLQLSVGLIDQTLRQSAGQIAPVEDLLLDEIKHAVLLHVDETPWRENGQLLWLWVFNALSTLVYFIGPRSAEMFVNALQACPESGRRDGFQGHLMSDGYIVYRSYGKRLRCLAHLLRKALGLSEATCRHTSEIGRQLLDGLADLIRAAQEAPKDSAAWLAGQQAPRLAELRALCERHQHSSSSKLGEFCREMLNDWAAIVRPLLDPSLPLTNNAAERILRHWVIARRISFGTRSEQGSRALALFASVIDTCRARKASAWDYLTAAITAGRQRMAMPPLPALAAGGE